jgi:hypothetical protein
LSIIQKMEYILNEYVGYLSINQKYKNHLHYIYFSQKYDFALDFLNLIYNNVIFIIFLRYSHPLL